MVPVKPNYKFLDHTADLGIVLWGVDLKDLFRTAALSLTHIMVSGRSESEQKIVHVSLYSEDLADLMVRWLGEIHYFFEGEEELVTDVDILDLSSHSLEASLAMVPFNSEKHEVLREIKAVTYHQIKVNRTPAGWEARVIFDI